MLSLISVTITVLYFVILFGVLIVLGILLFIFDQ